MASCARQQDAIEDEVGETAQAKAQETQATTMDLIFASRIKALEKTGARER